MLKNILIFLILLFFNMNAQSISENDSLYLISLQKYIENIDSNNSKLSNNKIKYDTIYLEETNLFDLLPSSINNVKIIVLTEDNLEDIYINNSNELIELKIFPIEIKKGQIEITLVPYKSKLNNIVNDELEIHKVLGEWTNVYFKFNCLTNKWDYNRTENGGI